MRCCSTVLLLSLICGCVDSPAKQADAPVPTAPAASPAANVELATLYRDARAPGPTDPDAPKDFTETASGLKYRVLRKTDGRKPMVTDTVFCNYRGTLDNGKEFDSTYKKGASTDFPLKGVIPGWTEGLQYCPVGGMIELEIPAELGYGDRGAGADVPPGATLHFIVELVDIL